MGQMEQGVQSYTDVRKDVGCKTLSITILAGCITVREMASICEVLGKRLGEDFLTMVDPQTGNVSLIETNPV